MAGASGARLEGMAEDAEASEGDDEDFGKFLGVMKAARDEAKDLSDGERRERAAALAARAAQWMGVEGDGPGDSDSD